MRLLIIAAASLAVLSASAAAPPAHAQSSPASLPISGSGDQQPGGLTAHDVVGKRLSDANGNALGQITGVSKDGMTAQVRPSQSGGATAAAMADLSLGTGARSVILGDSHPAPPPNWSKRSSTVTSTVTAPPVVVLPPQ
ncbi:MAG TPA: hypothetical protein VGV37_17640 [Aliidongia sp.]|uniref:hypothetical protein n=1 Tax=Aliidongia sp. TaxID=1914230 RepID=UPI002DDCFE74|nr:hypothetical protein [Aliidongia sp.]HEV2676353.1 hypothetical protein [Aliidongia sp.]